MVVSFGRNMVEVYRDFDWELDRFVEYRFPIKKPR
jgi:hypothetical protein